MILVADMVGFSSFSQRSGEEASFVLMRSLSQLMADPVQDQGGTVQSFTGDGILAVFGVPTALEDAPLRACRAALSMLQGLVDASDELHTKYGVRPQMRIGISTGPVVFGETQISGQASTSVFGDAVNLAARLQALAEPGTTVISETTHRLLDGVIEATFIGRHAIKGRTGAEKLYRLNSIQPHASRFDAIVRRGLTSFIGRDRELETLEERFRTIGIGVQVVDIVGEPGIGKSRLLHEFREQIVKDQARFVIGNCTLDTYRAAFSAFIEIVADIFRLLPSDTHTAVTRKLEEGLHEHGLWSEENRELLLNLLGRPTTESILSNLDGVLIGLRTRDLLSQMLRARSRLSSLVIAFEDLHWLDSASEELLGSIVTIPERLHLLILYTRRPDYNPPWNAPDRVTQLSLEPLSVRETSRIVQARLGIQQIPESLSKLIAAKADGNPLFAEEIVSFLVERGTLQSGDNAVHLDPAEVATALPETVHSLLSSRVDQLAVADRTLLQIAAVVGRRFDPAAVIALNAAEGHGEGSFAAMEALGLIRRDDTSGDYLFKHALVRDALYDALLTNVRVSVHLKVAEELERRYSNRRFEMAEYLAHHFAAAQKLDKAFEYLAMSGHKSLNIYATREAERYYRQALQVFEQDPACASAPAIVSVIVRLLETLVLNGDYRETGRIAAKHMPFAKRAGESPDLVIAHYYQTLALVQNFEIRSAHALMTEALAVADRLGDGRSRAYALGGLLQCRIRLGMDSLEAAERMKAELLDMSLRFGDNFIRNASFFFVSWDYCYRGLIKEAHEVALQLFASGQERNDPRAIGFAHWILGWIDILGGVPEAAMARATECIRAAIAPFDRLQGEIIKTVATIFLGEARQGLMDIDALNLQFEKLGALYSVLQMPRGLALIALGRISEGVKVIKRSIAQREDAGDRSFAAFGRISLAEFYIEALSGSRRRPSVKVILRNLGIAITIVLFGTRRAQLLLEEAAAHEQLSKRGIAIARINLDLGLLHAMRKDYEKAKILFDKARVGAESQGAEALLSKIDAALSRLKA